MTLTLRYAARSDRGLIRGGNQDSVYAGPRLLAVADGMGGMAAGDVASNIVIATMAPLDEWWPRLPVEPCRKVQQKSSPSTITSESLCFSIGFRSVTPDS